MGVLDDLALGGVERLQRGLGTRAAFKALVPLLDSMPPGPGRARALLRAIRYGIELNEGGALEPLTLQWPMQPGARHAEVRWTIRELAAAGHAEPTLPLAAAEVERTAGSYDEASARYAHGRCLEAAGRRREALGAYDAAVACGRGQPRLQRTASARAVRVLWSLDGEQAQAARRAGDALPFDGRDEERLALAAAALGSGGRYRRATALDTLAAVAQRGGRLGRVAIALAARHADAAGGDLSEIEADRIAAVIRHHPDDEARASALARLTRLAQLGRPDADPAAAARTDPAAEAFLPRAKAVLSGSAPGPRPPHDVRSARGRDEVGWLALATLHALRQDRAADVRRHLEEAAELLRTGRRVEAPTWTAILRALEAGSAMARELAAVALSHAGDPPPRGYLHVARALQAAGHDEEALRALSIAAARREPGAKPRLAEHLRDRGWRAASEGKRAEAIALLREARRAFGGR